jgi:hypothetical protein
MSYLVTIGAIKENRARTTQYQEKKHSSVKAEIEYKRKVVDRLIDNEVIRSSR